MYGRIDLKDQLLKDRNNLNINVFGKKNSDNMVCQGSYFEFHV